MASEFLVNLTPRRSVSMTLKGVRGTLVFGAGTAAPGGGASPTNLGATATPTGVNLTSSTGSGATIPLVTDVNAGAMAPAQRTKLAGISAGATQNSPDATLLARGNHTGTQLAATISDFTVAVNALVDSAINALVGGAPDALNTLFEVSTALGNDPNAVGTLTALIGQKLAKTANLADLSDAAAARVNLGLQALATLTSVTEAYITLSDNTTGDVSTARHGFVPKAPGDANKILNGLGAWVTLPSTPPAGSSGVIQGNIGGAFAAVPNWSFDTTTGSMAYSGGTITANTPALSVAQVWNNAAVNFEAVKITITDTQAAATSRYFDIAPASGNPFFRIDRQGSGGQATARHVLGAGNLHSQAFIFDARAAGSNERFYTATGTLAIGLNSSDTLSIAGTTLKQIGSNATSASTRNFLVQAGDSLGGNVGPGGSLTLKAGVGFGSGSAGGDTNIVAGGGGTNANGGAVYIDGGAGAGTGTAGDVYLGNTRGNTRLGGLLFPLQRTNATEPSYVKGAAFYNTDLGKMRVGGATAWETATSA